MSADLCCLICHHISIYSTFLFSLLSCNLICNLAAVLIVLSCPEDVAGAANLQAEESVGTEQAEKVLTCLQAGVLDVEDNLQVDVVAYWAPGGGELVSKRGL